MSTSDKWALRVTAFIIGLMLIIGVNATEANADTRPCVTKAEWSQVVNKPKTKAKVHNIFDTAGKRVSFHSDGYMKSEGRKYKRCNSTKTVRIGYIKYPGYAWWSYWG